MTIHLVPKSLQYLEQVAQLGSIQAASRELGISASAIHRQIRMIEDTLGELLFERKAQGMVATQTGNIMLELARDWRLDSSRLWSVIQSNRGVEHGHVQIAAMDAMGNGFVPELLSEIAETFPRIRADLDILNPDSAIKGVLNGDYDFAAVANATPEKNLIFHWSEEFPLGCIAAPGHPVAAIKSIRLSEFITYPVVFQSAALAIRKLLEARHGWIFERAAHSTVVNSPQLMKYLAVSGKYIALTSELDAEPEIMSGRLVFIPISDKDMFLQTINVISNAQMPESSAKQKIIEIAVRILRRRIAGMRANT